MNKFKVGDKVTVKHLNLIEREGKNWAEIDNLSLKKEYTISLIDDNDSTIKLKESKMSLWHDSSRFRSALARGTAEVYRSTYKSVPGFRYRLKGNNGEKVHPSEHYTQKKNALQTLSRLFPEFEVIDLTKGKKKTK